MDDQPVAVVEGTALRYIETDHLNTPRALIDPARNVPVWRWDLQVSAFGEHAANEDPDADGSLLKFDLRFPGQYLDAETGLHYNYFRDYEPGVGRYVESDPIGLNGGLATYSYSAENPVYLSDPLGLSPQCGKDCCKDQDWPQREGGFVGGRVVCCAGRAVACTNPNLCQQAGFQSPKFCQIAKGCVGAHERFHVDEHASDCASLPDGDPAPPRPPYTKASAECEAYGVEIRCLTKSKCNRDRQCLSDWSRQIAHARVQRRRYCNAPSPSGV
jgi:RHS repeat-associated protein